MDRRDRAFFNAPLAFEVPDPGAGGAIAIDSTGTCLLVSAGAESRSLANPTGLGHVLMLNMKTDGGDITLRGRREIGGPLRAPWRGDGRRAARKYPHPPKLIEKRRQPAIAAA